MRISFWFNGTDEECLKLAARLVKETEAEVIHSRGMQPTMGLDGVVHYGLEDIKAALKKVGVVDDQESSKPPDFIRGERVNDVV